jgi:UDP-glucose 4-epimerase
LTILVTGGAGYIGSQIAYRLADLGHASVILDDLSTGFREAVPAGVPLIVGSIEDLGLVRQLLREHRVEAVMHLAGSSVVEDSMRDPIKYLRNNASATIALLQACIAENVSRFIFSSSASVYGSTSTGAIKEDAPKLPINPYGWSKLIAEMAIETLSAVAKLDFVVLRYFNVAGADPDLRTGHRGRNATTLVHVASEVATGRRPFLPIHGSDYPTGDGTCIRDFIHVWDIAELHVLALEHMLRGGPSAVLNCGYGRGFSVLDVVRGFERVLGAELCTRLEARRIGDPAIVFSDATLARNLLRWTPRFDSIDAIIQSAVAWQRTRQER